MLRFDGQMHWFTGDESDPRETCRIRAYQTAAGLVILFSDITDTNRLETALDPVKRRFMLSGFDDAFWVSAAELNGKTAFARIRSKNDEFGLEPLPETLLREMLGDAAPAN